MASLALYLKYRPLTFDTVVGQEHVTRTLRNALRQGRIRHAYLFAGPRGTGKTTTARLLAKAVNCLAPEEERPCNACDVCVAINEGRLMDLIEIDAASNRGIDEIRDIREKVGFRASQGRFKVYVLDEAHMLTEPAFNALLKTLEEPPPHVIFALVTTEPHKIPATIVSRCQRFDFRRIPLQAVMDRLSFIAEQEGLKVEPAATELIARQGTGAMRDAISLLDQLTGYGDEISVEQVQMVLGTVAGEAPSRVVAYLADGDVPAGLDLINRTVADGADPRQLGREIVEHLRGLLLIHEGAGVRLLNVTAEQAEEMESLAERTSLPLLLRAIHLFSEAVTTLKRGGLETIPQLPLEMAFVEGSLEESAPAVIQTPTAPAQAKPSPRPDVPGEGGVSASRTEEARVAEQRAPAPEPDPDPAPESETGTMPDRELPSGPLSLAQVEDAWPSVLQAVRKRNPAAEGALRTQCRPVEVNGTEIVVTFPYPFLREKLGDPQRMQEIQEALTEVFQRNYRVKLALASEYEPRRRAEPPAQVPTSDEAVAEDPAIERISRWAKERGGEATVIET
jgi:DNA polymerase-3 subunit gamma/tau